MKVSEAIAKLAEIRQKNGDLDLVFFISTNIRYEVGEIAVCTNNDHVLIVRGEPQK